MPAVSAPATETDRPPRVLMIIECASGGTGRHVLDLSEGLLRRGCEVHVIYSTGRLDRIFEHRLSELQTVHSHALPMRTNIHPSDWRVVRGVRRYMRTNGPFDIIHGHSSKGGAIARLAATGTRTAAFYTLHGLIVMDSGLARWKRGFYLGIELCLSLRTRRIVAVSPEEARSAVQCGLGKSRVVLIPNGVDAAELTPREKVRQDLGVREDTVLVGFVGRLVEQKSPDVLIRAFARAVKAAPQLRLALIGDGPMEELVRALARELGIHDEILWLGARDAREFFAAFDVFAISSRKEGLPYVVLEAMAAGLPVVATEGAGIEILVECGINGTVVQTGDSDSFGDALAKLGTDTDRRERCGKASRRRAARFTIDTMVENTLAAYRGTPSQDAVGLNAANAGGLPANIDPGEIAVRT